MKQMPGVCRGKMLAVGIDWHITGEFLRVLEKFMRFLEKKIAIYRNFSRIIRIDF